MYLKKKHSQFGFHLPQIRRASNQDNRKSSMHSYDKSILSRFQQQLKYKQKKYYSDHKDKRKPYRLKTIDVNDYQTVDQLRRQLKSMKEQVSFKINQYNHRLANKIDEFVFMSALKKDQPVVYQPLPIYLPPMYPQQPMMPMMPYYDDDGSQSNYPSPYHQNNYYPMPLKRPKKKTKIPSKQKLKNFRKAAFAVLFTIRLRKFAEKVIKFRKQMFKKFIYETSQFKQQATLTKKLLVQSLKPFLIAMLQKQDNQLKIQDGDSENFKKQKIQLTKRFFQLLLDCLKRAVNSQTFDQIIKSVYYFCKHGSYACLQKLLTMQELQNISVSQKHFYLQAQKNLQKTQIINFLFMKILIYNGIGQSWKIDAQKFSKQKQTLLQNMTLVASILYELLMDIQDDFIVNSPQWYPVNNYQTIKGAKILPSQSLTVKPGQYRKNQVISGLINQNIIKSTYKLDKLWTRQRNQLIQIIQKIHQKIVQYHKKLIKPFL